MKFKMLKVKPETHRQIKTLASKAGVTMQEYMEQLIKREVKK